VSFCLAQHDDGLLSLLVLGSEEVEPAIVKAQVTGASRFDAAFNVRLAPIAESNVKDAMQGTLKDKWCDGSPAQVDSLYSQVGPRLKDLKRLAEAETYDLALQACGDIVDKQQKKISHALSYSEPMASQRVALLLALLASPNGVLKGAEIKAEWDVSGLEALNLVRFEQGPSPAANTLLFHHTAVQAAARVLTLDCASPLHEGNGGQPKSEEQNLQLSVTQKALRFFSRGFGYS
jgi:hypothetical protein